VSKDVLPEDGRGWRLRRLVLQRQRSSTGGVLGFLDAHAATHPFLAVIGYALTLGACGFIIGGLGHGAGTLRRGEVLGTLLAALGFITGIGRTRVARRRRG
jgi:hypothetical protein